MSSSVKRTHRKRFPASRTQKRYIKKGTNKTRQKVKHRFRSYGGTEGAEEEEPVAIGYMFKSAGTLSLDEYNERFCKLYLTKDRERLEYWKIIQNGPNQLKGTLLMKDLKSWSCKTNENGAIFSIHLCMDPKRQGRRMLRDIYTFFPSDRGEEDNFQMKELWNYLKDTHKAIQDDSLQTSETSGSGDALKRIIDPLDISGKIEHYLLSYRWFNRFSCVTNMILASMCWQINPTNNADRWLNTNTKDHSLATVGQLLDSELVCSLTNMERTSFCKLTLFNKTYYVVPTHCSHKIALYHTVNEFSRLIYTINKGGNISNFLSGFKKGLHILSSFVMSRASKAMSGGNKKIKSKNTRGKKKTHGQCRRQYHSTRREGGTDSLKHKTFQDAPEEVVAPAVAATGLATAGLAIATAPTLTTAGILSSPAAVAAGSALVLGGVKEAASRLQQVMTDETGARIFIHPDKSITHILATIRSNIEGLDLNERYMSYFTTLFQLYSVTYAYYYGALWSPDSKEEQQVIGTVAAPIMNSVNSVLKESVTAQLKLLYSNDRVQDYNITDNLAERLRHIFIGLSSKLTLSDTQKIIKDQMITSTWTDNRKKFKLAIIGSAHEMLDVDNTMKHFFKQMKQMTEFIPITLRLPKGYPGEEDVPYSLTQKLEQPRQTFKTCDDIGNVDILNKPKPANNSVKTGRSIGPNTEFTVVKKQIVNGKTWVGLSEGGWIPMAESGRRPGTARAVPVGTR